MDIRICPAPSVGRNTQRTRGLGLGFLCSSRARVAKKQSDDVKEKKKAKFSARLAEMKRQEEKAIA